MTAKTSRTERLSGMGAAVRHGEILSLDPTEQHIDTINAQRPHLTVSQGRDRQTVAHAT
jgi:hypothetical protein